MIPTLQLAGLGLAIKTALSGNDPNFANVVSLIHFDGPNGSTTITDQKSHAWTALSPAEISTTQSKFGGSSAKFTAGSGSLVQTSMGSADWNFGTGAFTIEMQAYFTASGRGYLFDLNSNVCTFIITPSSGLIEIYGPGSYVINAGSTPFNTGQWYAIALTRSGNTWRVFVDGVLYVSATDSRSWGSSGTNMIIGGDAGLSAVTDGYLDEWRVTKGVARYTSNYVPQTAPFPNS